MSELGSFGARSLPKQTLRGALSCSREARDALEAGGHVERDRFRLAITRFQHQARHADPRGLE